MIESTYFNGHGKSFVFNDIDKFFNKSQVIYDLINKVKDKLHLKNSIFSSDVPLKITDFSFKHNSDYYLEAYKTDQGNLIILEYIGQKKFFRGKWHHLVIHVEDNDYYSREILEEFIK